MITRGDIWHAYFPLPPKVDGGSVGVVRTETVNNVLQTWAIARPTGGYASDGAPLYLAGHARPNGPLVRGGVMPLTPAKPNVEMDPSNPQTWQRQYYFS